MLVVFGLIFFQSARREAGVDSCLSRLRGGCDLISPNDRRGMGTSTMS
jgi:hypothetical protein